MNNISNNITIKLLSSFLSYLEYSGMNITWQMIIHVRIFLFHLSCQSFKILLFQLTMWHLLDWRTGLSLGGSCRNGLQNWLFDGIFLNLALRYFSNPILSQHDPIRPCCKNPLCAAKKSQDKQWIKIKNITENKTIY